MRTEERIGRPFVVEPNLANACKSSTLELPNGQILEQPSPPAVAQDWDRLPGSKFLWRLSVDLDLIKEAAQEQGIPISAIEFVVIVNIGLLRKTEIIARFPVSEIDGKELVVDLSRDADDWILDAIESSASTLTSYLVLSESLPVKELYPFRKGTWLSRAQFSFGKREVGYSFALEPLGEEQYEDFKVARGSEFYVSISGDLSADDLSGIQVTIYLEEEILSRLRVTESEASDVIKLKLELAAVEALIEKLAKDCVSAGVDWEDIKDEENLAGVYLVKNLAQQSALSPDELFLMLTGENRTLLSTYIQKALKILKADNNSLKPRQLAED